MIGTYFAQLLPAFGFFGNTVTSALRVSIKKQVDCFRFILKSREPEFLNIGKVQFCGCESISLAPDICSASISTCFNDVVDYSPRFASGCIVSNQHDQCIHSKKEIHPWIEAKFLKSVYIDEILLFNRGDVWSCRNKTLAVEILEGALWKKIWQNSSRKHLQECIDTLCKWGGDKIDIYDRRQNSPDSLRLMIIDNIVCFLENGNINDVFSDIVHLVCLLDIWGNRPASESELKILAAYLLYSLGHDGYVPNFSYIKNLVPDVRRMLFLQDYVNKLSLAVGSKAYAFTRHGLREKFLVSHKEDFIRHLKEVIKVLDDSGRRSCLLYGTLLGALRNGEFISFDDDVDIGVFSSAADISQLASDKLNLVALFREAGFNITGDDNNLHWNFHVVSSTNPNVLIDIFPLFVAGDEVFLHMESMKIRSLPLKIFYPFSRAYLYGHPFSAPAKSDEFLVERYGRDWHSPNQFHEWPYCLSNDAMVNYSTVVKGGGMISYSEFKNIAIRHSQSLYSEVNKFASYKNISIYFALNEISIDGDWLQFGVFKGHTAKILESFVLPPRKLHLFDSFEGLPEDWDGTIFKKGAFIINNNEIPTFDKTRTVIHKGWFSDTVPVFAKENASPVSLVHFDADLYSSTLTALESIECLITGGTVLLFDEFFLPNEQGLANDECRAFYAWAAKYNRKFQILWRTEWVQLAVKILA